MTQIGHIESNYQFSCLNSVDYIVGMKTMLYAMVALCLCMAGAGLVYTMKLMAAATEVMQTRG